MIQMPATADEFRALRGKGAWAGAHLLDARMALMIGGLLIVEEALAKHAFISEIVFRDASTHRAAPHGRDRAVAWELVAQASGSTLPLIAAIGWMDAAERGIAPCDETAALLSELSRMGVNAERLRAAVQDVGAGMETFLDGLQAADADIVARSPRCDAREASSIARQIGLPFLEARIVRAQIERESPASALPSAPTPFL